MTILKGKLTYVLAGLAIAWGVVGYITGWTDQATALNTVWIGLAAFGLRRAM